MSRQRITAVAAVQAFLIRPRPQMPSRRSFTPTVQRNIGAVMQQLVRERYLFDEDIEVVVDAAMQRYAVAAAGGSA